MTPTLFKRALPFILVTLLNVAAYAQQVKEPTGNSADWSRSYEPFRVAGNLYWVGTYDLASYLITTPKGHILINTGLAASAPAIKANVEKLGFKVKDIKILLINQAHFDHVGAIAAIKKITGAKVMIDEKDAPIMADGGRSDYFFGGKDPSFQPVRADRLLKDNDSIVLGGTKLTMLHHPGHTKGSCSYLLDVKDSAKTYRVLIANMPSIIIEKKFSDIKTYPSMAKDYAYTLDKMASLNFDLWVAAHASQFDLHEKRKEGDPYNPSIFADKDNFKRRIEKIRKEYQGMMAEEK